MKNFIVVLFLSTYLFSAIQMCELLKINILIEHYIEHTKSDQNLSLWNFLCMHYTGDNQQVADYDKDMKLPFKSLDDCNHTSINFCTPLQDFRFQKNTEIKGYKSPWVEYHFSFSSNFYNAIWQPPKTC